MKYTKMTCFLALATALIAGCGGSTGSSTPGSSSTATTGGTSGGTTGVQSSAKLTVKAIGPNISSSAAAKRMAKSSAHAEDGIVFTSWNGSNAAYGVPVYVEATYTNPALTDLSGVSVVIATDHPELYDSVTVFTDATGLAKTTMYAKKCAAVQTTVNVTANAPDKVLVADPASINFMPSQLKLSSPSLGAIINVRDPSVSVGVDPGPNSDAIVTIVGGYETMNGANARFPWFNVSNADGSAVADNLAYSINAMGLDNATLVANQEEYATISPLNWPSIYPNSAAFYTTTQGGRIPEFTQITTQVPAAGTSVTLEIVWSVTITDPINGPQVGYVAGTVQFTNH